HAEPREGPRIFCIETESGFVQVIYLTRIYRDGDVTLETQSPTTPQALVFARNALIRGEWLAAIVHAKSYLTSNQTDAKARELLAIAHAQNGERSLALDILGEVVESHPGRVSAHYNRGLLLNEDGKLDEAMEEIHAALYIKPDHSGARALR